MLKYYDVKYGTTESVIVRIRIGTQSFGYAPIHLYALVYGTFSNISPI